MAAMKASLSEVENWRHSYRTLGLALHAASAADIAVAAISSSSGNASVWVDEELNPFGRSFPASKSENESNAALGNAALGRAGAVLGSKAPDIKGTRSSKTSDCMIKVG
jgi:hypothetical protein